MDTAKPIHPIGDFFYSQLEGPAFSPLHPTRLCKMKKDLWQQSPMQNLTPYNQSEHIAATRIKRENKHDQTN